MSRTTSRSTPPSLAACLRAQHRRSTGFGSQHHGYLARIAFFAHCGGSPLWSMSDRWASLISGSRVAAIGTWPTARQPPPSSGVPQGKNWPDAFACRASRCKPVVGFGMEIPMSVIVVGSGETDGLHPVDGWGDVPFFDRPLWSRYMVDHLPWFPGVTVMVMIAPGVMNGNTRAPKVWKETAQALHAAGFFPVDYYLLAELIKSRLELLDESRHASLFEQWPTDGKRHPRIFRLNAMRWVPWLEKVRAGESPRRALEWMLSDGDPEPLGGLYSTGGGAPIIVR